MGLIVLVRHGQASWGAEDYDNLSPVGHEQAAIVGRALAERGIRPTRLVAGAMRRHAQTATAAIEAAGWAGSLDVDDGWNEFDHLQMLEVHGPPEGAVDGEQLSRQQFDAWFESATQRWTGGGYDEEYDEPFHGFTSRVDVALRRAAAGLGSGETAVVFTSGGPVTWVAATLLGGGADLWMRMNPVTINASIAKVVSGKRGLTLLSLNEHAHLEPDRVTYR